ncbi:protein NYNRIN-like [Gossypium australe]|uniref:Protein NYNRIN-like n=1 Tax=Gossypium australe TaxID=47621 RepID=A0A5B6VNS7_9ROSI|nr:protein NYNRIN-like [Gossypium australe]
MGPFPSSLGNQYILLVINYATTVPTNDTKSVAKILRINIFARFGTPCALKTPLGMCPYKLVYEKNYHLPIELENKAYWAINELNLDPKLSKKEKLY